MNLILVSCLFPALANAYSDGYTYNTFTQEKQNELIIAALYRCYNTTNDIEPDGLSCGLDFTTIMCWPPTPAGEIAIQPCPPYIHLFDYTKEASRYCTENGTWEYNLSQNMSVENYTSCVDLALQVLSEDMLGDVDIRTYNVPTLVQEHIPHIQLLIQIGHGCSVIACVAAFFIMVSIRHLRCPRNTVHANLFLSFILRGCITSLQAFLSSHQGGQLLVSYVMDSYRNGKILNPARSHWECKLLHSIWMYSRLVNYVMIFVEGVYLHMLIFIPTFSDRSSIKWLIIFGWGAPLIFVIPWMAVRLTIDNVGCWLTYRNGALRWLIEAPICLLVVINFVFFMIILRLSFTKLKQSSHKETVIYRKMAKSTLVLIPLFGVHYIVFLFTEFLPTSDAVLDVVRFYFEATLSSFQGVWVASIFCFANGEVRSELSKRGCHPPFTESQTHMRRRSTQTALTYLSPGSANTRPSFDLSISEMSVQRQVSLDEDRTSDDVFRISGDENDDERVMDSLLH